MSKINGRQNDDIRIDIENGPFQDEIDAIPSIQHDIYSPSLIGPIGITSR